MQRNTCKKVIETTAKTGVLLLFRSDPFRLVVSRIFRRRIVHVHNEVVESKMPCELAAEVSIHNEDFPFDAFSRQLNERHECVLVLEARDSRVDQVMLGKQASLVKLRGERVWPICTWILPEEIKHKLKAQLGSLFDSSCRCVPRVLRHGRGQLELASETDVNRLGHHFHEVGVLNNPLTTGHPPSSL